MTTENQTELLDRKEAATYLCVSPNTLDRWRSEKAHIPYHKIGGAIRYSKSDLDDYLKSHRVAVA